MKLTVFSLVFCSFIILIQARKLLNVPESQVNLLENFELVNALGDFGGNIAGQLRFFSEASNMF